MRPPLSFLLLRLNRSVPQPFLTRQMLQSINSCGFKSQLWIPNKQLSCLVCLLFKTDFNSFSILHENVNLKFILKEGSGETKSMSINTWMEGIKQTEPRCFQWCPVTGPEAVSTNEMLEVPSKYHETLSYCEGDQAQKRCIVFFLGDVQKLSGHGSGQRAVRLMLFELEGRIRWPPLQAQPCCNSGILWYTAHCS